MLRDYGLMSCLKRIPNAPRQPLQHGPPVSLNDMLARLFISALISSVEGRLSESQSRPFSDAADLAWSRCVGGGLAARTAKTLVVGAPVDGRDPGFMVALQSQPACVTRRMIAAHSGRLPLLHAGAVSHPVPSGCMAGWAVGAMGNTTHDHALAGRHGYLKDDTIGIDENGRIRWYPRPPFVRPSNDGPDSEAPPDDLGLALANLAPTAKGLIRFNRHPGTPVARRTAILERWTRFNRSGLRRPPWRNSSERFSPWSPSPNIADPLLICSNAEVGPVTGLTAELIRTTSFRGIDRRTAPRRPNGSRRGVHRSGRDNFFRLCPLGPAT